MSENSEPVATGDEQQQQQPHNDTTPTDGPSVDRPDLDDAGRGCGGGVAAPPGGDPKYVNPETGQYDWLAHASGGPGYEQEQPEEPEIDPRVAQEIPADALQHYQNEFMQTGSLSQASYDALDAMGYAPHFVDRYIAGVMKEAQDIRNRVFDSVGGMEEYGAMLSWAEDTLPPEDIDAFNQAAASGNVDAFIYVAKLLHADFREHDSPPNRVIGTGVGAGHSAGYESWSDVVEAMRDPRYKTDAAYREKVEAELAKSNNIEVSVGPNGGMRVSAV